MRLPSAQKLAKLVAAVGRRVGFDPQSVGDQSLLRTVRQRMAEGRVADGDDYVARLLNDGAEFAAFIEDLVIPETWFFRDRQPFRCVQHYAKQCWRPTRLGDRLRVLSIPCSTGEEPYSIAMALLDAGLTPFQFQVEGADLSRQALCQAEEAVFAKSSFRGDEAEFPGLTDRFLDRQGDHYVANAELRGMVWFCQANLVSPSLLADQPKYQVVFCRNVLIYFDADARRTALANLRRLLSPDGLLYVGHVEARVVAEGPFRPFGDEFPFAFSPATSDDGSGVEHHASTVVSPRPSVPAATVLDVLARNTSAAPRVQPRSRAASRDVAARPASSTRHAVNTKPVERETKVMDVPTTVAAAHSAANAGRLDEATGLCQEVLAADPTSASAIYLRGIISEAQGDKGAAKRYYQKVLYLDPRHKEALVHMMLLAQERGDEKSTANFRRRAEQIQ